MTAEILSHPVIVMLCYMFVLVVADPAISVLDSNDIQKRFTGNNTCTVYTGVILLHTQKWLELEFIINKKH